MIIRILTQGQYKIEGNALLELDSMDNALLDAVAAGAQQQFAANLNKVVGFVQRNGIKIPDEELVESDLIIPAPDTTLQEAQELFVSYPRDLV